MHPEILRAQLLEVSRALVEMAPPGVITGARVIDPADEAHLRPLERAGIAGAVAHRRHEFASGRVLLRSMVGTDVELPLRRHQAPAPPADVRWTLAHDHHLAVAAISRVGTLRAIGIDVEPLTAPDPDAELTTSVLRDDDAAVDALLAFVIKEAAYKTWSTLGAPLMEPHDVRILTLDGTHFTAVSEGNLSCEGRWARAGGRWLALTAVR